MQGLHEQNKQYIYNEFNDDPLFNSLLLDENYKELVFTSHEILSQNPLVNYSTTTCANDIFRIPFSTLSYYLRELEGFYIDVILEGRHKRLPYKSVVKLHLVILCMNKGETLSDIQTRLGGKTSSSTYKKANFEGKKYSEEVLDRLFKDIAKNQNILRDALAYESKARQIENKISDLKVELVNEQAALQAISHEEEYEKLQRKADRQSMNALRVSLEKKNGGGLFSMFKKTNSDPNQFEDEVILSEMELSETVLGSNYEAKRQNVKDRIKRIEEEIAKQTVELKKIPSVSHNLYIQEDINNE